MDDRKAGTGPERALERALKAAAASRRPPEPPAALRDIAWGRSARAGRGNRGGSAADLAWVAALAACLACSVLLGRADSELARRLDGSAIARAIEDAVAPAGLSALGLSLRGE